MEIASTVEYYEENAQELLERYDDADMSSLHKLFLQYIPKESKVLDIGFGSGRDLAFLDRNNYDVWGMDSSKNFVKIAKQKFSHKEKQFFVGTLPNIPDEVISNGPYDSVVSIAVWMHIPKKYHEETIHTIKKVIKPSGYFIISYSIGSRGNNDKRFFETLDPAELESLFRKNNFELVETQANNDSLGRDTVSWITLVFKNV